MVLSGRNDLDSCTSLGWRMVARQNPHLAFAESAAVTRQHRVGDLQVKWSGRKDLNLRPPGPEPGALARLRYAPTVYARAAQNSRENQARIAQLPRPRVFPANIRTALHCHAHAVRRVHASASPERSVAYSTTSNPR